VRLLAILALLSGCSAFGSSDDAASGTPPPTDATDASDAAVAPVTCALLGSDCGGNHACYPFPFDSEHPSGTLCGVQGTRTAQVFCTSQLDCDAQSICSDPGQADSICLTRCDPIFPFCAVGQGCSPLPKYPGVGVCL
jgi:hypothetical protein